jgi:hypothetical protein
MVENSPPLLLPFLVPWCGIRFPNNSDNFTSFESQDVRNFCRLKYGHVVEDGDQTSFSLLGLPCRPRLEKIPGTHFSFSVSLNQFGRSFAKALSLTLRSPKFVCADLMTSTATKTAILLHDVLLPTRVERMPPRSHFKGRRDFLKLYDYWEL